MRNGWKPRSRKERDSACPLNLPLDHSVTVIGEGIFLRGTIQMDNGMMRLDGRFEGTIVGDGLLLVGKRGFLRGEIQVKTLIICGRAEGTLTVLDHTQITSSGSLVGKLRTRQLMVEEGGRFDGEGQTLSEEELRSLGSVQPIPMGLDHLSFGPS